MFTLLVVELTRRDMMAVCTNKDDTLFGNLNAAHFQCNYSLQKQEST
jgi:hypothetical protein